MSGSVTQGLAPETMLRMLAVPEAPKSFVLTPYERPSNVMGQQVRAINLIFSLLQCKVVKPGDRIGIIGAGVAGVTAAAYAASRGCPVTILEKRTEALTLFANSDRPLYPRLFDWPDPGWDHEHAELPVMSWRSHKASDVARSLRHQWEGWLATFAFRNSAGVPFLEFVTKATPLDIRSDHNTLVWRREGSIETRDVAAILLMIGLGSERRPSGVRWTDYWNTDEAELQKTAGDVFVSGNGDGAIQDLLNVVVDRFSYSRIATPHFELSRIAQAAENIEAEVRFIPHSDRSRFLTDRYMELAKGSPPLLIRPAIGRVLMTGRSKAALDQNAYALNRFLLAHLITQGLVEYRSGEHDCREVEGKLQVSGAGFAVQNYQHAIIRHGLQLNLDTEFPELAARMSSSMRTWGELRLTRQPMWPAPIALALAQTVHRSHRQPSPPHALYADFLDPLVQARTLKALGDDRTRLVNLYRGRLRILSLISRRILVTSQHVIDGVFFQSLAEPNLRELAQDCRIEFIKRGLLDFLRFAGSDSTSSWADAWLAEKWERKRGFAKPYFFHSLKPLPARTLFAKLETLNQAAKPYSARSLIEQVADHGGGNVITASKALDKLLRNKDASRRWSSRPPRNLGARFHIHELFDPGWLWEELSANERDFLVQHGQEIIPARRPRQAFVAASLNSKVRNERGPRRLESWLYHSYHRSIAHEEGADAWETVWTGACEWSRWGLSQHLLEDCAPGVSFELVGAIDPVDWARARRVLQSQVDDWYLERRRFSQVLVHPLLKQDRRSRVRDPLVSAWCTGEFEWRMCEVPPRCQIAGVIPFVIYESHGAGISAIMQLGQ